MADILDQEAGSELFASYEAELKLVQADLSQKLEQIPELTGEPKKAAISQAERSVDEAKEIVSLLSLVIRGCERWFCGSNARAIGWDGYGKNCTLRASIIQYRYYHDCKRHS